MFLKDPNFDDLYFELYVSDGDIEELVEIGSLLPPLKKTQIKLFLAPKPTPSFVPEHDKCLDGYHSYQNFGPKGV